MKKQCISILLILCMAAALFPFVAAAAEAGTIGPKIVVSGTWGKNAVFELTDDGVFTITGTGVIRSDDWHVTYPSEGTSIPVFDKLVVSDGIERIEGPAFAMWGMKEAIVYGDISGNVFWECMQLETIYVMNAKEISSEAFSDCGSLKNVYLADSVQQIWGGAFEWCRSLETIRIPQKIMRLHDNTFRHCTNLKSVTMPAVQHVGDDCFLDCKSLKTIYYAGTEAQLKSMEYSPVGNVRFEEADFVLIPSLPDPFYGYFDMPAADNWAYEGIRYCLENGYMNGMGDGMFQPNGLTTRAQLVTILWRRSGEPKSTKKIPFTDCDIAWAKDAIAWAAENGIVNGIGKNRFDPNGNVTREQVVTIFYRYCREYLKKTMAPGQSLKSFPDAAMVSAWAKDAMEWGIAVKLISGVGTSKGTELQPRGSATRAQIARIIMNYRLTDKPASSLQWSLDRNGTLTITGSGAIPDYTMEYTEPGYFDYASTPWVSYQDEIRSVVIGEGITRIGNYVFCNARNLNRVSLPSTLREIGAYAFNSCPIRVLKLPSGLVSIGRAAFGGTAILELVLPGSVTKLGEGAFRGCMDIQTVKVPGSVTELPKDVFGGCPCLTEVFLPAALKVLHEDAFRGTMNIEDIYFGGTEAQWQALREQAPGIFYTNIHCNAYSG